jgi:hypothetical protein
MRSSVFEKLARTVAGALIGALLVIFAVPLLAQPADSHQDEVSKEVTISAAVSAVLAKPTPGMLMGAHLLLATTSGQVDASLGRWALQGKGALPVTVGQQVEVTGRMQTANRREVFIARTVKVDGKVYAVRSQHGIEISPVARERAAERGETL